MRIYERLRIKFGFQPLQPEADPVTAGDKTKAIAPIPSTGEGTCCGHCSGQAESHFSEQ